MLLCGNIIVDKQFWKCGREVYCTGLENQRLERVREFESHRFRQNYKGKFVLTTSYEIPKDYVKPVWKKNHWLYCGKQYRSLRELKIKSHFKLNKQIGSIIQQEITKELDKELLEILAAIANG